MVYQWKDGARLNVDAQTAGEVCAELEAKNELTAKNLLEVSRPEQAPLHKAFEWDDETAAENWREQQARHIINSLVVNVDAPHVESVRCFFKVTQTTPNYRSLQAILKEEDSARALLDNALRELETFRAKYFAIKELQGVISEIDKVKKEQVV